MYVLDYSPDSISGNAVESEIDFALVCVFAEVDDIQSILPGATRFLFRHFRFQKGWGNNMLGNGTERAAISKGLLCTSMSLA